MQVTNLFNFNPTTAFAANAASAANTTVFLAATNVNGAVLMAFAFVLNSTVASAAQGALRTIGANYNIIGGRIDAGAILAVPFVLPAPLFIPAGVGLEFSNIVSPAVIPLYGAFKIL